MDDARIIDLYWQRSETAIAETEIRYGPYLIKIAYNILSDREDSRESVNDTYLAAWNSIPPHRPDILSAYLAQITRRIAIDVFRAKTRAKRVPSQFQLSLGELEDCLSAGNTTEEAVDAQLLSEAIARYLRQLPKESRTLFLSRYYFLDSLKEAAAHCGVTESKAKMLLYRTRLGLKDYLIKEGFQV